MLVEDYFREIEGWITDCPYVAKSCIEKDKRSFHVGIISFPHHKQLGSGEVIAAAAPNLKEVLQEIETILAGTLESY